MKKIVGLLCILLLVSVCVAAAASVPLDEEHFPDHHLCSYLAEQYDVDHDDILSDEEIERIDEFRWKIADYNDSIEGLEYLTNLQELSVYGDYATEYDVSKIKSLVCLDVSDSPLLEKLTLDNPNLESIEALLCPALKEIDLTHCAKLMQRFRDGLMYPYTKQYINGDYIAINYASWDCMSLEIHTHVSLGGIFPEPVISSAFTDPVFRQYIIDWHDANKNGKLDEVENSNITEIIIFGYTPDDFHYYKGIKSLAGIEYLPNLNMLEVCCEDITSVNIRSNHKLERICLQDVKLKEIDISGCKALLDLIDRVEPFVAYDLSIVFFRDDWDGDIMDGAPCLYLDGRVAVKNGETVLFNGTSTKTPVTSVTLNQTKATLTRTSDNKKPTLQLTAEVGPEDATNQSVEWTSSNPKIAKVDENGKVTALKKGTAVITCTAKDGSGVTASCKITVKDKLVTKITLNKKKVTIKKGKTFQLKVTKISPADAFNQKVIWKSSNTKIATVDKNGKVKAKKKGTCTITCTAKDGSGKKATCKITVK